MCFGKMSSKIFWNTQFPTKLVFPDMTLSVFRVRPDELAWPGPAPHHCASPNMLVHSPTCAARGCLYNPLACLDTYQLVKLSAACTILKHVCAMYNVHSPTCAARGCLYNPLAFLYTCQLVKLSGACTILKHVCAMYNVHSPTHRPGNSTQADSYPDRDKEENLQKSR